MQQIHVMLCNFHWKIDFSVTAQAKCVIQHAQISFLLYLYHLNVQLIKVGCLTDPCPAKGLLPS